MKGLINKAGIACTAVLLTLATAIPFVVISSDVSAQEITSAITGTVLLPNGQPATGASAVVTDSRDGRRQTSSADDRGIVHFRSVSPGGPYTIRITAEGYEDLMITDLYTDVAGTSSFTVALETASADIEEITVTAAQIETIVTASGPSSSFSLQTITDMPSTQRQIRDIIRLDPRVSIGATGDGGDQSGAISCLGGSARTNSFTVDGVRATDAFGLNLSGNLSRFTFPIPFDTVAAAAVEFAPVSVEYGQFSGCNVNVVTKSGENEFHGGAFYLMNDDGLTGTKIDGEKQNLGTFERENYGVEFSGPIIQDKLFFYGSYEKFETATVNPYGSADDASFPRSETALTTAELNQIKDILISKYDRDPGEPIRNLPVESERYFARIDWNINDSHRLEGTFASVEESTLIGDDIGGGRGGYTFSDNFHARGSDSETYGVRLYSDWTDRLSTELRYSSQEVIDLQNPFGGGEDIDPEPKARITICTNCFLPQVIGIGEFAGQDFVSGPGTFRSANKLTTNKDQFKFKADYQWGDHLVTAGYEYETLDVFNLFIINATGTIMFDSVAALDAGTAFEIEKGTSYTRDPNDAAAAYTRDIHSVFLQDKWDISDRAQLIFGVRYDWYVSDDPGCDPAQDRLQLHAAR
jgi:outer membrane receptor protein involved in Fe transport